MESKDDPERVSLNPLDPLTALKALLAVDPESEPSDEPKAAAAGAEPVEKTARPKDADD